MALICDPIWSQPSFIDIFLRPYLPLVGKITQWFPRSDTDPGPNALEVRVTENFLNKDLWQFWPIPFRD